MEYITSQKIISYWKLTIEELKALAVQGDAKAQSELGHRYYKGIDIDKDLTKAMEWYFKAASQGEKVAQFFLGLSYLYGNGVDKDEYKAVEWLTKSADQDYEPAEYCLGECFRDGTGVEKDLDKANELFSKAKERKAKKQLEVKYSKEKPNGLKWVSPYQENAFSEPAIHQAVMNQIDFALPDLIWEHINEAFEHYWDDEIGVGGYFDYDSMFFSIKKQLIAANILYPNHLLFRVIEAVYNYIDTIPGVVIHD